MVKEVTLRAGLRFRFEQGVDPEVRRAILDFGGWLREQMGFPIGVPVYVKKAKQIKNMSGELVSATFYAPYDKNVEPYIRISTGDYYELAAKNGKDNALGAILNSVAHELAHYQQWLLDKPLSCKNARKKASRMIDKYAETQEHP